MPCFHVSDRSEFKENLQICYVVISLVFNTCSGLILLPILPFSLVAGNVCFFPTMFLKIAVNKRKNLELNGYFGV